MAAKISVTPRSSLMDRAVKICISGLKAHQRVTLHAAVVGDGEEVFESHAHYIANKEGKPPSHDVTASMLVSQNQGRDGLPGARH